MLRAVNQRECQHVGVADQQAENAFRLPLAGKFRRLNTLLLIPNPSQPFRGRDRVRGRKHRADEAIEGEEISPTQEFDLMTILAIIGGVLLFLFISGGLVGLALSTL